MFREFISKIRNNLKVIIPILIAGIFFSILSLQNIKVGYHSKAYYKMSYVLEKFYFQYKPRLLFETGANNLHLIERLHRLMKFKEIFIPEECYIGSVFDDSNEYARRRNQLGFNPGYDFKISRLDNVLTIIYNSAQENTEFCVKEFLNSFETYQERVYLDFLNVFDLEKRLNLMDHSFITFYGKKYNLLKYYDEYLDNIQDHQTNTLLSISSRKEIEKSGTDPDLALHYLGWVASKFQLRQNLKHDYFKRVDGELINDIYTATLTPNKIIIILIINFLSITISVSYILIKEYEL